jgi:regulatory protein
MSDPDNAVARAKRDAYRLLASRSRTAHEMRNRLERRGHLVNAIEQVIHELVNEGHINDRKLILDWARYRLQGKPLGRRRLSWEIQRRGIDSELLEEALDEVYGEFDQVALAERALRKRLRVTGSARSKSEPQKLSRYLANLGFDRDTINAALAMILGSMVPLDSIEIEEEDPP